MKQKSNIRPNPVDKKLWYGQPKATINYDVVEVDNEFEFESITLQPYVWDYGSIVSAIVREKYSQDRVEAILANNAIEAESEEMEEFQAWRVHAKEVAHELIDWADEHGVFPKE